MCVGLAMAAKRTTKQTVEKRRWEDRFISAYTQCGVVSYACQAAGIGRAAVYDRREKSPAFAKRWADAEEAAVEGLEQVAIDRARGGSDLLLIFLLKAHKPHKYRDRMTIQNDGPTGLSAFDRIAFDDNDSPGAGTTEAASTEPTA